MSLKNWSTTAASNNSAAPNGAPEGWALSDINNTMRQVMADVRTLAASNTIASAATCDLGSLDETFLTVSGTTTITALGTVSAGIYKFVTFSGILTLTHNGTSLILPGAANITTVAGDTALFLSLGSGNWKCMVYQHTTTTNYQPLDATLTALASSLTAANKIPYATATDTLGELTLSTSTSLGTSDTTLSSQKAVKTYVDASVAIKQRAYAEYTAITGITTVIPLDDTTPLSTEGDQILSVSITPSSATNRIRARFMCFASNSSNGSNVSCAIFDGTTCKNASTIYQNSLELAKPLNCEVEWVPGDTAAHTVSVRVGPSANTAYVNANYLGTRYFGGTARAVLIVEELLA